MINLTFLGTSGAIPTKKRNHTSILLVSEKENILIDCGEGTQRQFKFAKFSPQKITRLLITHWHGDHVLGIPGLLQTLSFNNYSKTLRIYGPKGIKKRIQNMLIAFPMYGDIKIKVEEVDGKFLDTDDFYIKSKPLTHGGIPTNAYVFVKKGKRKIDKKKLKKTPLPQGPLLKKLKEGKDITYKNKKYLATKLTYKEDDKKISFVFDTSMNKKIVPLVKNSDLLISEATYDSSLSNLAKEHNHLTTKQAAEIAKKSSSKKLALIHYSDRYEKDSALLLKDAKSVFKNSFIMKDLESISV
jgi:ribonuclease Z